jgi:hypothetical protein
VCDVTDAVHEIGAVAGWAGVVGLVVLSALHVSHARDIRRLRDWADRTPERSGSRAVPLILVGVLVLGGAAAYGATQLTGGRPERHRSAVKPGDIAVAVLNGTMVPHLAARLRDQIAAAGFRKGRIDVYSDQQLAESVVQYAPGHEAEAKAVSRSVGISRREPVTADSRALAGGATVIVIAGADKAP